LLYENKRGVNGMAMDGREASNANQGFRGVFLTDLPGIDGGGEVWLFAAFTHGRVTFLASLFRFSIFDS
jgi:hypothetical protein